MYSFVIRIAIDVVRAVLLVMTKPTLVLSDDKISDVAESNPFLISVKSKSTFSI